MRYRQLGRSELQVSVIGFGGFALGGRWWGRRDDRAALAAVRRALDLGINLFDTAPVYGSGLGEELLARGLES
ncbi:MAG TPA: aldo/keto reductase [Acidobacteriota bacterium]